MKTNIFFLFFIAIGIYSFTNSLKVNDSAQINALTKNEGEELKESNLALNKAAYSDLSYFSFFPYKYLENPDIHQKKKDKVRLLNHAPHLVTDGNIGTSWISDEKGTAWIYTDLGKSSAINAVKLLWGKEFASKFTIEISDDAKSWTEVYRIENNSINTNIVNISDKKGRYLKLNCLKSTAGNLFILNEFEIIGKEGNLPESKPIPAPLSDGTQYLTGGNWKVQRGANVVNDGSEISKATFNDDGWLVATVPGTVLTSYLNDGAIPDPYFGDQQLLISDEFFNSDFWYRDEFTIPANYQGQDVWLNFDGINWKAEIYFNGAYVGKIDGAFNPEKFNVTKLARVGSVNGLAVLIHAPDNPGILSIQDLQSVGKNSGEHSKDSPAYFCSLGWDWIPTIRGRNIGIWDHVYFSKTGQVKISNPYIITDLPLPDLTSADLSLQLDLENLSDLPQSGILYGSFGEVNFQQKIELKAQEQMQIVLDKNTHSQLRVSNPKLWWPNGYGEQNLYTMKLDFKIGDKLSDHEEFNFGIREMTYNTIDNILKLFVNGHRIFVRGGNWGMADAMLNIDKKGYDNRLKLQKAMNFNMIRNWVGQTAHHEFYDACDKYGILIWDDFWLSTEWRGRRPNDQMLFMVNAKAKILKNRNHPALAVYCGRNEGLPDQLLENLLPEAVKEFDPSRFYFPSSRDKPVGGGGPWYTNTPQWYFLYRGGQTSIIDERNNAVIHSEMGMPCIPEIESMIKMMPSDKLWPQNDMWGVHDFSLEDAQDGSLYNAAILHRYGAVDNIVDYCKKAQLLNYENHKAMFEAYVCKDQSNGMLMWMSQSAWPSLVWQTYDYYLETNGAYFGCKKAAEPLHIMWNYADDRVYVRNSTPSNYKDLMAKVEIYSPDGKLIYDESKKIDISNDEVVEVFKLKPTKELSKVHFIKLRLNKNDTQLSENFYWSEPDQLNYQELNDMPQVKLLGKYKSESKDGMQFIHVQLKNPGKNIALMVRLIASKSTSGELILPVFYSDNYVSLLPGETRNIDIEFENQYLGDEKFDLQVEGWNTARGRITQSEGLQIIGVDADVVEEALKKVPLQSTSHEKLPITFDQLPTELKRKFKDLVKQDYFTFFKVLGTPEKLYYLESKTQMITIREDGEIKENQSIIPFADLTAELKNMLLSKANERLDRPFNIEEVTRIWGKGEKTTYQFLTLPDYDRINELKYQFVINEDGEISRFEVR